MNQTGVELPYFKIGTSIGGSQDWMSDPWMRLGGCAALAAVDSCIYLSLFQKKKHLLDFDPHKLTKDMYKTFAMEMKPYLRPRFGGVSKMSIFVNGFGKYLKDKHNEELQIGTYAMGTAVHEAGEKLVEQMDKGILVPVLLLNPISKDWKEYRWHWFILGGYRITEGRLFVKAITYSESEWLPFDTFWDEKDSKNGGLILYDFD